MTTSTLTDILYDALERENSALLAGVIGTDGLSVELVLLDGDVPHDRAEAEAELSTLVLSAAGAAQRLGVGALTDLVLETELITYLVSYITPGYYAVLGVQAGSSLGRARFTVRQIVDTVLAEL
jgi:predicted regulator of Ras-like GTPase activity (Roadblock/LC7/MglB family)